MNKGIAKYSLKFFRWFCKTEYIEDIEGDLLERFEKKYAHQKYAQWRLALDVLRLFRPGMIKTLEGTQKLNYYGMLKHNIKIGWRSILRKKAFSFINII